MTIVVVVEDNTSIVSIIGCLRFLLLQCVLTLTVIKSVAVRI